MALSKKQRKALRDAKKGGITKSESKKLKSLGIPNRQAAATVKDKGKDKGKDKQIKYGSKEYRNLSVSQKAKLEAKGKITGVPRKSDNPGPPQQTQTNPNKHKPTPTNTHI